jgi:meso-butanediol dehydrogenase / (S,S)-butanediol dehydrogenase / diacetyl reductase
MNRFNGKIAIVTGAGSGIGRATAIRLASEEGTVACVDVDESSAQKTVAEIGEAGGHASAYACNVGDPGQVRAAIDAITADLGAPNVLCNIAGIHRFHHSTEVTLEQWNQVLTVNLTGTFLMAQAVLPHLLENGGNIVNCASNAGLQGLAYSAAYCASKGGVVQLTRALALEYIHRGVRVNAVAPGGVNTPLSQNAVFVNEPDAELMMKMSPLWRMAEPEELASLFAYAGSDEASGMTGSILSLDGGLTA